MLRSPPGYVKYQRSRSVPLKYQEPMKVVGSKSRLFAAATLLELGRLSVHTPVSGVVASS
jgi:hypothetical protein